MTYSGAFIRPRALLSALFAAAAAATVVAFPVSAHAATHSFGTTSPGGGWGCPGADFKYGNAYTLTEWGSVTKITAWMKGNGGASGQSFRAMIYAADGPSGGPGTLLATSSVVTVVGNAAPGAVDFPLSPAVPLAAGTYWLAQQSGPGGGGACLAGTGNGSNSFNGDPFGDGPSNPFSASGPISTDANVWTLSASYDTDATAPTIAAAAAPAANANGWNNGAVAVTFTCTDAGSGVASVTAPVTLSNEGQGQSASGTCTDKAGNTASATASGINIDRTAPTVSFGGNGGHYGLDDTVHITCAATDALSGVAASTCPAVNAPAYTLGGGQHTLSASATDRAGNTATASTTFTVDVTGGSLCELTRQFVEDSDRYQALSPKRQRVAEGLWNAACRVVGVVTPRLSNGQKRFAVAAYDAIVRAMARDDWLTDAQAATLTDLADGA